MAAPFRRTHVCELGRSGEEKASGGFVHDPDGIDEQKLAWLADLKDRRRGRVAEYVDQYPRATFHAGGRPWRVPCQLAFPCATQNEVDGDDARALVANGVVAVAEGANMPSDPDAVRELLAKGVLFGPAKAANAGGVAVSGLEQTQNSMRLTWSRKEVDERLKQIMLGIHETCVKYGDERGVVNYVHGANRGGFVKVAEAMLAYGVM